MPCRRTKKQAELPAFVWLSAEVDIPLDIIFKKDQGALMDAVLDKLNENLQVLFRKALDADKALDQLSGQGKAKHKAIFPAEAGFTTSSERFAPYIAELSEDIAALQQIANEEERNRTLSAVVKKMESLFVTLAQFKGVLAE